MKTITKILLGATGLLLISSMFSTEENLPSVSSRRGPDQAIPQGCVPHVELYSASHWAEELGWSESRVVSSHRINLWSKSNEEGKGQVVGKILPGSRAVMIDVTQDSYKVRSPLDGSIGWLGFAQISRELMQDSETREQCGEGDRDGGSIIQCPDGTIYMGNDPDNGCI